VHVKLYENQSAEMTVVVQGQSHAPETAKAAKHAEKAAEKVVEAAPAEAAEKSAE
jgi:hypothetical protein